MQRSVPEVAEATKGLEREPLGYGAERVRSGKGGSEGLRGREWNEARRNARSTLAPRDVVIVGFGGERSGARNPTSIRKCAATFCQ